jgi:hypothetical protein
MVVASIELIQTVQFTYQLRNKLRHKLERAQSDN